MSLSGVPSIHSMVRTSRVVRSQSISGARNSGSRIRFSANSDAAAASRRKSISMRTLRASVSTTSTRRRRRRLGSKRSAVRAAKNISERSRAKRRSTPGRSSLTATSRSPSLVRTRARCTCAIEAAATASPNSTNTVSILAPKDASTRRHRDGAVRRRHAVLQLFELHHHLGADDVGARGEKLPELDIGRAEPIDGGGKAAEAAARRAAP